MLKTEFSDSLTRGVFSKKECVKKYDRDSIINKLADNQSIIVYRFCGVIGGFYCVHHCRYYIFD